MAYAMETSIKCIKSHTLRVSFIFCFSIDFKLFCRLWHNPSLKQINYEFFKIDSFILVTNINRFFSK